MERLAMTTIHLLLCTIIIICKTLMKVKMTNNFAYSFVRKVLKIQTLETIHVCDRT